MMSAELSNLTMSGSYSYMSAYQRSESLSTGYGGGATGTGNGRQTGTQNQGTSDAPHDMVSLSDAAKQMMGNQNVQIGTADPQKTIDANVKILSDIIYQMTGTRVDLSGIEGMFGMKTQGNGQNTSAGGQDVPNEALLGQQEAPQAALSSQPSASGSSSASTQPISYQSSESYYQRENVDLKAQGVIKTSDGHEIDFSVELNVTTEVMAQRNVNLAGASNSGGVGNNKPLALNYDGNASDLKNMGFSFGSNSGGSGGNAANTPLGSGLLSLIGNVLGNSGGSDKSGSTSLNGLWPKSADPSGSFRNLANLLNNGNLPSNGKDAILQGLLNESLQDNSISASSSASKSSS